MNNYIVISLNLVFCRSACSLTEADEEETILSHLFIEEDDLLLLQIANKYHHSFENGSPLDTFSKNYSLQKIV